METVAVEGKYESRSIQYHRQYGKSEFDVGGGLMANVIHARQKPDPGFNPTSKTLCFRCMDKGTRFVFIDGNRRYACQQHFHMWEQACLRSERERDKILGGD